MDERFIARFWPKVDTNGDAPAHCPELGPCWNWTAWRNNRGYGAMGRGGRGDGKVYAHRASWEIANGAIPGGLWVLHKCDNRRCVRPSHLFLGTHDENMADARDKSRTTKGRPRLYFRGVSNPKAKLTPEAAAEIRRRYVRRKGVGDLAREFGVSAVTIRKVASGNQWQYAETDKEPIT